MKNLKELIPPFATIPLPKYMRVELNRRISKNYGLNFVDNTKTSSEMASYRGNMSTWLRVVSNGKSKVNGRWKEGFVLRGGDGYKNSYGIENFSGKNRAILGFDRMGEPHYLDTTSQPVRPCPGVESIEVDIRKGIYRLAFVKWKCYTIDQLNYMTNYFFAPYTTVLVEWGWNNYNPSSLTDISEIGRRAVINKDGKIEDYGSGVLGRYTNPQLTEQSLELSEGRYDCVLGNIINFDFTYNPSEMCFNCTTEIASNSKFYFGLSANESVFSKKEDGINQPTELLRLTLFKEHVRNRIESLSSLESYTNSANKKIDQIDVDGRIFSPNNYAKEILNMSNLTNFGKKVYISIGLLNDIIEGMFKNSKIDLKIDLKRAKIGAHPNLISCSEDLLIPNAIAPYYPPESLSDPNWVPLKSNVETQPHNPSKISTSDASFNVKLEKLFGTSARQDLNEIINYISIRTGKSRTETCFPDLNRIYSGDLKNLYLSFDLIKSKLENSKNLKSFLESLCEFLNGQCPLWRLEVVDFMGTISIRDENYLDSDYLNSLKDQYGTDALYEFSPYTQDSILKEFSFGVKLTDNIASVVINQVNNEYVSTGGEESVTNVNYVFPPTNDYILDSLISSEVKVNKTVDVSTSDKDSKTVEISKNLKRTPLETVNEKAITFVSTDGGITKKSRLVMPGEVGLARLKILMDDNDPRFINLQNQPIPGVKVEFSILGISGFQTFQVFKVKNLPKPYDGNVIFQITDIKHSVTDQGWITRISAAVRKSTNLEGLV